MIIILILCVCLLLTSATALSETEDSAHILQDLEDFLAIEDRFRQAQLTIYCDYAYQDHENWPDIEEFVRSDHAVEILVKKDVNKMGLEWFRELKEDALIPVPYPDEEIEIRPCIYYKLEGQTVPGGEDRTILEVMLWGHHIKPSTERSSSDIRSDSRAAWVNGAWYCDTAELYGMIWQFLPESVKESYQFDLYWYLSRFGNYAYLPVDRQ